MVSFWQPVKAPLAFNDREQFQYLKLKRPTHTNEREVAIFRFHHITLCVIQP